MALRQALPENSNSITSSRGIVFKAPFINQHFYRRRSHRQPVYNACCFYLKRVKGLAETEREWTDKEKEHKDEREKRQERETESEKGIEG